MYAVCWRYAVTFRNPLTLIYAVSSMPLRLCKILFTIQRRSYLTNCIKQKDIQSILIIQIPNVTGLASRGRTMCPHDKIHIALPDHISDITLCALNIIIEIEVVYVLNRRRLNG